MERILRNVLTKRRTGFGSRALPFLALAWGATGLAATADPRASASPAALPAASTPVRDETALAASSEEQCRKDFERLPGAFDKTLLETICKGAETPAICASANGTPIYVIDRPPRALRPQGGRRVLVFAMTHGDEPQSGALARDWLARLALVDYRNHWRVVPVLNPDGWQKNTRENANGVDLNRNFPTADWDENAHLFWKKITGANIRRFPGKSAGSEPETRCAVKIIEDFKPELIVSIHTPYGLLDFDGPMTPLPRIPTLPAKRLGNFPGSLGRYMWADRKTPVLTVELHGGPSLLARQSSEKLQDSIGDLVIRATAKTKTAAISP